MKIKKLKNLDLEPLPFEEAIAFFADKVPMTTAEFYELAGDMRAKAFTVARISSMDVIMDIRGAVEKAIGVGETLMDFKGRLSEIMASRGWGGLTPWHAETVFRNNIQTAYSVGRWNQMQDMGDRFYGEYDAVNDSRTRPTHAALDGKIFPMDHLFWDTWWPPNGHRCRCSVNPVHKYEVEEEGLTVETESPMGMKPDPGWGQHPGKTQWKPDLEKYPDELKNAFTKDLQGQEPIFKNKKHQAEYERYLKEYQGLDAGALQGKLKKQCPKTLNALDDWTSVSTQGLEATALKYKAAMMENRSLKAYSSKKYSEKMIESAAKKIPNREYLRIRAMTQAHLKTVGVDTKKLYRGTDGRKTGPAYAQKIKEIRISNPSNWHELDTTFKENALAGWTDDRGIARGFGDLVDGITTEVEFKAQDIFLDHNIWPKGADFLPERETIVFGDLGRSVKLESIMIPEGG